MRDLRSSNQDNQRRTQHSQDHYSRRLYTVALGHVLPSPTNTFRVASLERLLIWLADAPIDADAVGVVRREANGLLCAGLSGPQGSGDDCCDVEHQAPVALAMADLIVLIAAREASLSRKNCWANPVLPIQVGETAA